MMAKRAAKEIQPSLTSVLVSDRGANTVDRVVLATGATTTLGAAGGFANPNGIAYDASGNLYISTSGGIAKVNPVTGAVIGGGGIAVDGLTYDSVSNMLWGGIGGCIYSFNLSTLAASGCIDPGSSFTGVDGVVSDGAGHILVADSAASRIYQYTIAGGALVALSGGLANLDDIAPASGLGAPPSVPEPATLTMFCFGLAAIWVIRRRARAV